MTSSTSWGPQPPDPEHAQAFGVISDFFRKHRGDVVEVEILPADMVPPRGSTVLEDGLCLGVPKRLLAAAFVAACGILFSKRASSDPSSVQQALDATVVILLFDPEHLTAANFRRAQLGLALARADDVRPVHLELNLLDSILTSYLHRQSKSPTLWGYRAWILQSFDLWPSLRRVPASADESLTRELTVVLTAAERHPKNYYAWQYARHLFSCVLDQQMDVRAQPPSTHSASLQGTHVEVSNDVLLNRSISTVHAWCLRNPSDTSAWSFLYFLVLRTPGRTQLAEQLVNKTFSCTQVFRWRNESLWTFLRTVLADPRLTFAESGVQSAIGIRFASSPADPSCRTPPAAS